MDRKKLEQVSEHMKTGWLLLDDPTISTRVFKIILEMYASEIDAALSDGELLTDSPAAESVCQDYLDPRFGAEENKQEDTTETEYVWVPCETCYATGKANVKLYNPPYTSHWITCPRCKGEKRNKE